MKTKRMIGLLIAGYLVGAVAHAQTREPWRHAPSIIVVSAPDDPRMGLVDEAVSFWNKTFTDLGSDFRLGPVRHIVQPLPDAELQALSRLVLASPGGEVSTPEFLSNPLGDITVFLAQSEFISFTGSFDANSKRVIGIRGAQFPPMNMPNVALNVIAHEFGHAIGLRHNNDPSKLMCGRPAPCRPAVYRSDTPHIFPLTDDENRQLLLMYPPQ
jgi:hypothetical protein